MILGVNLFKQVRVCVTTVAILWPLPLAFPANAQAQSFSVLYNFGSRSADPSQPNYAGIIAQGRDGNLYSTATAGGKNGFGAVFKIRPSGSITVLYHFDGPHGSYPSGGLTLGTDGNFYGTTFYGGSAGQGTIFKITPGGALTVLHDFTGPDGGQPTAPPIQGSDGNFYGMTYQGGSGPCPLGCGTVYKVTSKGHLTTLYQFDQSHGWNPTAPLVQGSDRNFYGTTSYGGTNNNLQGVFFRITSVGNLTVLYNFDDPHGSHPSGPLIQLDDGNFYGTTASGGSSGGGVVFKVTLTGDLTVLHNMTSATDGSGSSAGLVLSGSKLYGANGFEGPLGYGTIFALTPESKGFSVIYNFDVTTGARPCATLFQHTNGILYGDTFYGGIGNVSPCLAGDCGVFYSVDVGREPFVSMLSSSGKVGKTIQILGQGFIGTTDVSFNGTPAVYTVVRDSFLKTTVPAGATSGFVTVTTPSGTLKSNKKFRVQGP